MLLGNGIYSSIIRLVIIVIQCLNVCHVNFSGCRKSTFGTQLPYIFVHTFYIHATRVKPGNLTTAQDHVIAYYRHWARAKQSLRSHLCCVL